MKMDVSRVRVLIGVAQERLSPQELLVRAKMRARNAAKSAKHRQGAIAYYRSHPRAAALQREHCPEWSAKYLGN